MGSESFRVRLSHTDWDSELKAWRCDAARVADVVEVRVGATPIPFKVEQDLVFRADVGGTESVIAFVTLKAPKAQTGSGERWKLISGILGLLIPVVGVVVAGVFNLNIEVERAAAQKEITRMQEVTKRLSAEKASLSEERAKCESKIQKFEACVNKGGKLDCGHGVFNLVFARSPQSTAKNRRRQGIWSQRGQFCGSARSGNRPPPFPQ